MVKWNEKYLAEGKMIQMVHWESLYCPYTLINIRVCGRTFSVAVCNKNKKSFLNMKDTYVRSLYYVNGIVIGDSPL